MGLVAMTTLKASSFRMYHCPEGTGVFGQGFSSPAALRC